MFNGTNCIVSDNLTDLIPKIDIIWLAFELMLRPACAEQI